MDSNKNAEVSSSTGEDLMEDGTVAPYCVYFYYVNWGKNNLHPDSIKAYVHQTKDPIGPMEIETIVGELAQRARDNAPPVGWALGDLRWRRKSYMAVVLDDPDNEFADANGLTIADYEKSFEGKKLTKITTPRGLEMQAIYCFNRMTKKDGSDWASHGEPEPFRLNLLVRSKSGSKPVLDHDDVGQNLGPPVYP